MSLCGRQHYAVCHGNGVLDREPCRLERCCPIEIYNSSLLHDRDGSQCFVFIPLLAHSLEYFEY
jgi:hypothetical protein